LSDFFERNGTLYYDNLTRVREKNDLAQWFRFFLVGVIETAKSSIMALDSILKLQKEIDSKLQTLGSRSANAQAIVNDLFQHPILYAQKAKEIAGARRGKFYLFRKYIKLFK